ncbi:phosphohistidine phosphatase [Parapedobacter composti]|uniref:Phosphohistidine phosphatase n=1 Tax=Parapedobacter composti TaxID=623281 RepID=A0A1I1E0V0_9SPHI|nr:histidine phosphatase family protein [Parapedobacter composti]SFB78463.1 phosphohistidine phosphatase [Parapedobacter composti]
MAKHLFIIRHAKSDWSFNVDDIDRPLNTRGLSNAPEMARRLAAYVIQPGQLVSSPAKRAFATAEIFAQGLEMANQAIVVDDRIYEAHPDVLLQVVNGLDDHYQSIALFGHNPGMALFASYLTGQQCDHFPTCAIMHIGFDDTDQWAAVSGGSGVNRWFVYPKGGDWA